MMFNRNITGFSSLFSYTKMASTQLPSLYYISSYPHLFLLLGITLISFSIIYIFGKKKSNYWLPPGPPGLPILGNLHMLGDLPHQNLCTLSKKYGPMMSIRLGLVPCVVISSPDMAEMFLKTHDIVFASRPIVAAVQFLSYGQKGMIFSPYGDYWRYIRKFCTLHLLCHSKIESFMSLRKEEVRSSIESVNDLLAKHQSNGGNGEVVVDLSERIGKLVEDITCRMMMGSKLDQLNLKPVMDEGLRLVGAFNLADYVPYIGVLDLQGFTRRMKVVKKVIDEVMDSVIEDHLQEAKQQDRKQHIKDFVDVMLSLMNTKEGQKLNLDISNIKALILDMFAAATDTATATIDWALAELMKHPRVMKLVKKELESVVGLERMVEETDLVKLEYLEMVVKETMRLHPVVPLLIPHESVEDININGYDIANKLRVIVNVWAIGRDPNIWSDTAEDFYPERFVGSGIDLRGNDFRLLPFGSGRRGCPGMQLGLTMVRLVLAQLVHCFNWELPNGMSPEELDMTEKFGLTMSRASRLLAVPTFRLKIDKEFLKQGLY